MVALIPFGALSRHCGRRSLLSCHTEPYRSALPGQSTETAVGVTSRGYVAMVAGLLSIGPLKQLLAVVIARMSGEDLNNAAPKDQGRTANARFS
jgi:hypothetical protein